jgi:hypothetical protein
MAVSAAFVGLLLVRERTAGRLKQEA